MSEEDEMLAAVLVGALIIAGVGAIAVLYRRQWHVRLLREIRQLPEHSGHRDRV